MPKNKPLFSHQVPSITSSRGMNIQPDLLVVIKDGKIRIAKLQQRADLPKLIRQMEALTDNLKDLRWVQNKKK